MTDSPEPTAIFSNDWRWNSQAPPPISGQVRTNSQDWSINATHLFINYLTDAGVDLSTQLKLIVAGTTIDLAMKTDATRNVRFKATGVPAERTDTVGDLAVTYADIPVTFITFSGTIPNSGTLIAVTATLPVAVPLTVTAQVVVTSTGSATVTPKPPDGGGGTGSTITWKSAVVATRPNRWVLTCTCAHGSLTETNGTRMGSQPVPPMAVIETTALNLIRRTGCTCAGLVAAMAEDAEVEVASDVAGL